MMDFVSFFSKPFYEIKKRKRKIARLDSQKRNFEKSGHPDPADNQLN